MCGDHFVAYLCHPAATTDPTMRASGRMSAGSTTKLFRWIPNGGDTLVIRGAETASRRHFTQTVAGIGGGQFPSVPVVPGKGGWTLTESIAAHRRRDHHPGHDGAEDLTGTVLSGTVALRGRRSVTGYGLRAQLY